MLEEKTRGLIVSARDRARRDGIDAEFLLHREKSSLIRLGNSSVALSTSEELTRLSISVQDGRKVGSYGLTADITSSDQLRQALARAQSNCRAALEKDYDPLFGTVEESIDDCNGFDPELENLSPESKTDLCSKVIGRLKPGGNYDFSGSWSSGSSELYLTTTANDREAFRRLTDSRFVLVLKEQNKKWELSVERTAKAAGSFTAGDVVAEFENLLPVYERNPGHAARIGRQRVLFGPEAISELAMLALWGGFLGRWYEEKRAFTANLKPGDKLFSELITLVDDPTHPDVFGMSFDAKGRVRRPHVFVEKGIFRSLLYDSSTAAKYGRKPTGHDIDNIDCVLATGTSPAGLEAGKKLAGDALYIPQLHYIHMPDPTKGVFTGSSRFNAMRLENGEFTAPLFSTRITDSSPSVFSNVVAISSRSVPVNQSSTYGERAPEAVSVPEYLLCDDVRITDVAESF